MKKTINLRTVVVLGVLAVAGIAGCQKSQTLPASTGNLLSDENSTVVYKLMRPYSTYGKAMEFETGVVDTAKPIPWTHIDTGARKTLYLPPSSYHVDTGANKTEIKVPGVHIDTGSNKTKMGPPPGYTHIDTGASKTRLLPPGPYKHIDTGKNKTLMVPRDYEHIDTGANKTFSIKPPIVTTPDTVKPVTPPSTGGGGTVND